MKTLFSGRILLIGCGYVGRCTLPLLLRYLAMPPSKITVLDFVDNRAAIAAELAQGVRYEITLWRMPTRFGVGIRCQPAGFETKIGCRWRCQPKHRILHLLLSLFRQMNQFRQFSYTTKSLC